MHVYDAHIHLFPDRLLDAMYRWFCDDGWQLPYALPHGGLISRLQQAGVSGASVLLYTRRPGVAPTLNAWLRELVAGYPWLVPFGTVHPDDDDLAGEVRRCLDEYGFAGMKIHCNVQRVAPDDLRLEPLFTLAEERQAPVIIHAGRLPYPDEFTGAARFRRLLERHPALRVQVAHLGADEWEAFFALMGRYEGVVMDTSWISGNPRFQPLPAAVLAGIAAYPDRILYGSDLPFIEWDYQHGVAHLAAELGPVIGSEALAGILAGNARRFLGLDTPRVPRVSEPDPGGHQGQERPHRT